MAKPEKKTARTRRTARSRRPTSRSWGFERLEDRTVLSATAAPIPVFVLDLREVRGWEPPQVSKTLTTAHDATIRQTVRLDYATLVLIRTNTATGRAPAPRDDGPEGEASVPDPPSTPLQIRASELPPTLSEPTRKAESTTGGPFVPSVNSKTSSSSGSPVNNIQNIQVPERTALPPAVVSHDTSAASTTSQRALPFTEIVSTDSLLSTDSSLHTVTYVHTLRSDSASSSLTQTDLLPRVGESEVPRAPDVSQASGQAGQRSAGAAEDGNLVDGDTHVSLIRVKRLRRAAPLQVHATTQSIMQQIFRQLPTADEWGMRAVADPAAELAEVLATEAARVVAVPSVAAQPEDEGGAVALNVEDVSVALPADDSAATAEPQSEMAQDIRLLPQVQVRMDFEVERYQAFDVATEPQPAAESSGEIAVNSELPND